VGSNKVRVYSQGKLQTGQIGVFGLEGGRQKTTDFQAGSHTRGGTGREGGRFRLGKKRVGRKWGRGGLKRGEGRKQTVKLGKLVEKKPALRRKESNWGGTPKGALFGQNVYAKGGGGGREKKKQCQDRLGGHSDVEEWELKNNHLRKTTVK